MDKTKEGNTMILGAKLIKLVGMLLPMHLSTQALTVKVGVIGKGKLGSPIIEQLAKNEDLQVRALSRTDMGREQGDSQWFKGDLSDKQSLHEFVKDLDVCIFAAAKTRLSRPWDLFGDPTSQKDHPRYINVNGLQNLLEAAEESGTECKVIRITGFLREHSEVYGSPFAKIFDIAYSGGISASCDGDELLEASKLDWTIYKPGRLISESEALTESEELEISEFMMPPEEIQKVSREKLAKFIAENLDSFSRQKVLVAGIKAPSYEETE